MKRDAKTKILPMRLTPKTLLELKEMAEKEGVTVSELARRFLHEGVEEKEELDLIKVDQEILKEERIAIARKSKKAIKFVDTRRDKHRGLVHFANYLLKRAGYKVFDTTGKVPDLIICDRFGNITAVEVLTHPTERLVRKKIKQYVQGDVTRIIFVVPEKQDDLLSLFDYEFVDFISP